MKGTLPRYRPVVVRKVGMEEGPNASRSDLFFGIENLGAQHLFFSSKETLSFFCLVRVPGTFGYPVPLRLNLIRQVAIFMTLFLPPTDLKTPVLLLGS